MSKNKLNSVKNWMNKFLDSEVDHDERRLRNAIDHLFDKASAIIDEKNVELAQLTIDLAQKNDDIRRLEEIIRERNEELLDLQEKANKLELHEKVVKTQATPDHSKCVEGRFCMGCGYCNLNY